MTDEEPIDAQPDLSAPTDIAALPDYWDERRRRQGKPDLSRCAAELRVALAHSSAVRIRADQPSANFWAAAAGSAHGTIALLEKTIAQGVRDDRITKPFGDELLEIAKGGAR